ncbi:hypothetical protein [Ornithinibacillus scapharcae]|uniref:hypothetical protein n=1 Tax=Ornithinibacillus scapharcae TaxID=1147159 RepID=UPI000225B138|nr:hypothetical protein [Ornithinibacillus scapharcae]
MKSWLSKDDKRVFILLGILMVLEALNIGLLSDIHWISSQFITVLFLILTSILLAISYQVIKEKYKYFTENHHSGLKEQLEIMMETVRNSEQNLLATTQKQYELLSKGLHTVEEQFSKQLQTLSDKISDSRESMLQVLQDSKEELLKDSKTSFIALTEKVEEHHKVSSQQILNTSKQLSDKVQNNGEIIITALEQEEARLSEQMNLVAKQQKVTISGYKSELIETLNQQHETETNLTMQEAARMLEEINIISERLLNTYTDKHDNLNNEIKEQTQLTATNILQAKEQISAFLELMQVENDNVLEKMTQAIVGNHEQLVHTLYEQKKLTTDIITNGNRDVVENIQYVVENQTNVVSDQLNQVKDNLGERAIKAKEEILNKINEDSLVIVDRMNEQFDQVAKEQHQQVADILNGLDHVTQAINEHTLESTSKVLEEVSKNKQLITDQILELGETGTQERSTIYQESLEKWNAITQDIREATKEHSLILGEQVRSSQEEITVRITKEVNQSVYLAEQALEETRKEVIEKFEVIGQKQSDLMRIIEDLEQEDITRYDRAMNQVDSLKAVMNELQDNAMNRIQEELATLRSNQLERFLETRDQVSHQITDLNKHIELVTKGISSINEELKENKANQEQHKIIVTDIHHKVQSSEKLTDQHNNLEEKVDALAKQLQQIQALVTLLQKSSRNQIVVEETTKSNTRVEKITDEDNGIEVLNHFNKDFLTHSDMYQDGKKVYTAIYDRQGVMTASKNYDANENVITEMTYYADGSVKERIERITRNGRSKTFVTKFDQSGRKI